MIFNEYERTTNGAMAHGQIVKVAKEIAAIKYDSFAYDNDFYKLFPDGKVYADKEYGRYLGEARRALAMALNSDKLTNEQKEDIFEALQLDRSLPVGRISGIKHSVAKAIRAKNRLN